MSRNASAMQRRGKMKLKWIMNLTYHYSMKPFGNHYDECFNPSRIECFYTQNTFTHTSHIKITIFKGQSSSTYSRRHSRHFTNNGGLISRLPIWRCLLEHSRGHFNFVNCHFWSLFLEITFFYRSEWLLKK